MSRVESLSKFSKRAAYTSLATAIAGPGFVDFPVSGGGELSALGILADSPSLIRGHGLNTINPFGGYNVYTPESIHMQPNGTPDVTWHATYHPYTFAQGFDMAMGEATIALLASAGIAKLASVVGRRLSRGSAKK